MTTLLQHVTPKKKKYMFFCWIYTEELDALHEWVDKILADIQEANDTFEFEREQTRKGLLWYDETLIHGGWRVEPELFFAERKAGDLAVRGFIREEGIIWTLPFSLVEVIRVFTGSVHVSAEKNGDFYFSCKIVK